MLNFNRFIVIANLSLASVAPSLACGADYDDSGSYNLFRCVKPLPDIKEQRLEESAQFWAQYLGVPLTDELNSDIRWIQPYHFDPDNEDNSLIQALRKRKLTEGLEYLRLNTELDQLRTGISDWEYRKAKPADYEALLTRIEALKTSTTALTRRKTFLKMRCLFALKDYTACMRLWDNFASKWEPCPLRTRMEGYVAGIYYHRKQYDKAIPLYFELGDDESIQLCVNRMLQSTSIEQEYEKDPDSQILGYILEDYANYYYHSQLDEYWTRGDEDYPIWTAVESNCQQVIALAERVVSEGRAKDLQMWQAFAGFLQLTGHHDAEAYRSFVKAEGLRGNGVVRPLLRHYKLTAQLALEQKPADFDQYLARELTYWKSDSAQQTEAEVLGELYGFELQTRIMQYVDTKADSTLSTLMSATLLDGDYWPIDRGMSVDKAQDLHDCLATQRYTDPLGVFAMQNCGITMDRINEMLGTKLMRADRYDEAARYLAAVSDDHLKTLGITPYLLSRSAPEQPFTRLQYDNIWQPCDIPVRNVKLEFCREVIDLKQQIAASTGEAKATAALTLARKLFDASAGGDLWAMSEYGWSSYGIHRNELNDQAVTALRTTIRHSRDYATLVEAHFGLAASNIDVSSLTSSPGSDWVLSSEDAICREGYAWLKQQTDKSHPLFGACDWLPLYQAD